jgi:hypothetical protein
MSDKFSHTVMPKDEEAQKQQSHGLPGIQLPSNAEEIKEFAERRNVDAKALNEEIKKAEQAARDLGNDRT